MAYNFKGGLEVNYILEIKSFYEWLEINPGLSPQAVSLWFALLQIANKSGWRAEFSVSLATLQAKSCCGKDSLYTARDKLVQAGLIHFRRAPGGRATFYSLAYFTVAGRGRGEDAAFQAGLDEENGAGIPTETANINKPKLKPKPKPKKDLSEGRDFVIPGLEEVAAYCLQRDNGLDPEKFVAYYDSNGWMIGKNKMANWRQAVVSWEKNQLNQPRGKPGRGRTALVRSEYASVYDKLKQYSCEGPGG